MQLTGPDVRNCSESELPQLWELLSIFCLLSMSPCKLPHGALISDVLTSSSLSVRGKSVP